jgi:hypothetical protein
MYERVFIDEIPVNSQNGFGVGVIIVVHIPVIYPVYIPLYIEMFLYYIFLFITVVGGVVLNFTVIFSLFSPFNPLT